MILCIDIGGTMIKTGLLQKNTERPVILEFKQFPTKASQRKGQGILEKILEMVNYYQQKFQLCGVAISTAGIVDPVSFEILYANQNIPEYQGINFSKVIQEKFHLPCIVENDVNAATIAEWCHGSGKKSEAMFCLTLGTGIGGGIILNHKLYRGSQNRAAEIGYMTVDGKSFETLASTTALIRNVTVKTGYSLSGEQIVESARLGDQICIDEINRFIRNLCSGIATIIYLLNPEYVVIGGGISQQREYLQPLLDYYLKEVLHSAFNGTKVVFADLGNHAGMIGASVLWRERFEHSLSKQERNI